MGKSNKLIEAIAENIGDAIVEMLDHAIEYGDTDFVERVIETLRDHGYYVVDDDVRAALEESVKLQSHYATLLNQYDGGERMTFKDADEWIARLAEVAAARKEGSK